MPEDVMQDRPITSRQVAAALALLGLTPARLSDISGIPAPDITAILAGAGDEIGQRSVCQALESQGIAFIDDGVQLRAPVEALSPAALNASNDG